MAAYTFDAGAYRFTLVSSNEEILGLIRDVFALLRVEPDPPDLGEVLTVELRNDSVVMVRGGAVSYHASSADLLAGVTSIVNRAALDADPDRIHLHAGAASKDGSLVLLAGRSGDGKTTTTSALLGRGFAYHSDEMVALSLGRPSVESFPKPLSVKRSGFRIFAETCPDDWKPPFPDDAAQWLVPAQSLGAHALRVGIPSHVVLLGLDRETQNPYLPVSPADCLVGLVEQCMDLDRFGASGLSVLARLAASCTAIRVPRSHPREMAATIDRVVADVEQTYMYTEVVTSPPEWEFEPVTTVLIGDEAVVRNVSNGQLASLNPEGTAIWADFLRRRRFASDGFLGQLQRAGILAESQGARK